MASEKYEIVIFGATGFTGRLAALYVAKQYGSAFKWAIAGRAKVKLDAIKGECQGIPDIFIADSGDMDGINAMVKRTKVVVTFAGPFSRYGSKLVASCVKNGVDYCDITGESDWVREMIAKYDDDARASGARIVHLCGHDSLPWDIMTLMLSKKLKEGAADSEMARVEFWDDIKSQPSGGTLETAFGILLGKDLKVKAPEVKALGFDPLLKAGGGAKTASTFKLTAKNVRLLELADEKKQHAVTRSFFFMAGVNANSVKRSNAINKYGSKLVYCEGQAWKSLSGAVRYVLGMMLFGILLAMPPTRWLMRKYVLPKPGEGASEAFMDTGYLNLTGVATATDGRTAKATIRFPVDPGYKDTARMAIESGLALALDTARLHNPEGGVRTPGAVQGEVVLERLLKTGSAFEYH